MGTVYEAQSVRGHGQGECLNSTDSVGVGIELPVVDVVHDLVKCCSQDGAQGRTQPVCGLSVDLPLAGHSKLASRSSAHHQRWL